MYLYYIILYYIILYYIIYIYENIPIQEPTQCTNTGSSTTVIRGKDYPPLNDFGLANISTNIA